MDQALMQFFLQSIRETVKPSTGCTEPGAVALNTALARRHARGAFRRLSVRMDEFLFKNAMGVGIPGSDERGVALCAALGVTAGNPDLGLCALENVTPEQLARAKQGGRQARGGFHLSSARRAVYPVHAGNGRRRRAGHHLRTP